MMDGVAVSSNLPKAQAKLAPGVQLPTELSQEHDHSPEEEPGTVHQQTLGILQESVTVLHRYCSDLQQP